jgi:hypothetical protein
MSSWIETPHVLPTINVNLKPCTFALPHSHGEAPYICGGPEVLLPCPIQRSVTFTVQLGECIGCERGRLDGQHFSNCPARPIRVACSIGGETWAGSEVVDVDLPDSESYPQPAGWRAIFLVAARDRWALVKALVTGSDCAAFRATHSPIPWTRISPLVTQRDAVFAALADMARMERAYYDAAQAIHKALPSVYVSSDMQVCDPEDAPSSRWLSSYVEFLVEQVGVMP